MHKRDDPSDSGYYSYTYSKEQENHSFYWQVEEFRVKMHHDWESSQNDGQNYFVGYESDSLMMQEQQSQFTTGLKQATKEDRGSDDFPRLPNWQPKNQTRWAYSGEYWWI